MNPDSKLRLRDEIWSALEDHGEERFPGARGRIPNFRGRDEAADQLWDHPEFREADRLKVNPDSPQTPVRRIALERGKVLYMAVPRLKQENCFLELDPASMEGSPDDWCTIKGASRYGRPVHPDDMPRIDGIVTGAVGVDPEGHRLGKGEGYSDLEFAILLEQGRIDRDVPIWTTIHPLQELEPGRIPSDPHDLTLSGYALPDRIQVVEEPGPRPAGLDFQRLSEEELKEIPILRTLLERAD